MIYIDFEQLGTPHATPALLGVLPPVPDDFTAYVLNAVLASAVVARRYCRVANLETALSGILAASDDRIVSWSEHDLRIVQRARLSPALVKRFESRWCNALEDARRWKNRLYRERELPAVSGADNHALKRYMKAVGYTVPARLAPGNAARWLRHVLERLAAHSGVYRDLSPAVKRHWHALLEYNRHDCMGMRAVHRRALRELALDDAYRRTTYRVQIDDAVYPIRIGRPHRTLDATLHDRRVRTWACITAYHPQSVPHSSRENRRRDAQLKQVLGERGLRWHVSEAVADTDEWPPEPGVLALDIGRRMAVSVAREFDQAAIVWGQVGGKADLVWCNRLHRTSVARASALERRVYSPS